MTSTEEDLLSLDHYVRKTFHKTASLMANSCKAIAILGGQNREVAQSAWEYGRHVGLSFQVLIQPMCAEDTLCMQWQGPSHELLEHKLLKVVIAERDWLCSLWTTCWTSQVAPCSWASLL